MGPRRAAVSLAAVLALGSALGQPPVLPPEWFPNRSPSRDAMAVSFCEDPRDPVHEVDRAIAEAIAEALLLEPRIHVVDRQVRGESEYEGLYIDLIDNCSVYLGFKLYAEAYPEWLMLTRPYYEGRFVVLAAEPSWQRLEDVPRDVRIGVVQGTMGDIRFITFNNSRPAGQRWQRTPVGPAEEAFGVLLDGGVGALIVWEPTWWALSRERPELAELHVVEAPVVSEPWIGVGGITLADRQFVRSQVDQAIEALTSDGTIAEILERYGTPARPVR